MGDLYNSAIENMLIAFDVLNEQLGSPARKEIDGAIAYRYKDQSIHVAILLKLARVVTGLQAMHALNHAGFIQEQAALQRIEDELTEDVSFLSYAVIFDDFTNVHEKYLSAFFEEEFEESKSAMESSQKRLMVPRPKIRAYINKDRGTGGDQYTGAEAGRSISKAYSGYVHAAAPHIMELYYGNPPSFRLTGNRDSPLYRYHQDDMLSYFYRGILAFSFAAKAYENEALFEKLHKYSLDFANRSGNAHHLTPYTT